MGVSLNKFLEGVKGVIPNTSKEFDICLGGKDLIVTGGNGAGKTSFLRELYRKVNLLVVQKKFADLPRLEESHRNTLSYVETLDKGTSSYKHTMASIEAERKQLEDLKGGMSVELNDYFSFSSLIDERLAVIAYFEAARTANISHADTAKGITSEEEKYRGHEVTQKFGNGLEQHLVNLRSRRSLAITEDSDDELAARITSWFDSFQNNLKILMEDDSTELVFDSSRLKFSIRQAGKNPYTFQTLSSGYLAIFDIYADLLMRTEYFKVRPEELVGLVFIDELDAHLHVSLQRLILPFLTGAFPMVQFVVSTHSPFVIMSVDDAVIFDVGRNQQVDEDLSLYSYSAVMEGLLGTKTTSRLLDEVVGRIASLVNSDNVDYQELSLLLDKIRPVQAKLDNESRAFYMRGENTLLERGAVNV